MENAPLAPFSCFLCGQGNGPFVDLQKDDEDTRVTAAAGDLTFGSVAHFYVCARCAVSMAQIVAPSINLTVVNTDQMTELVHRVTRAEADLSTALSDNANLRSSIQLVEQGPPVIADPHAFDVVAEVDTDTVSRETSTPTPVKRAAKKAAK